MGIGDQLCLVSAIQAVADRVGPDNVLVAYDPSYPGSKAVWGMAGLPTTIDPASGHPDAALIPCRGHIMESLIGLDAPCLYGEVQGNPIAQILYNWGWHGLFSASPVRLRLTPDQSSVATARAIANQYAGGIVACTPLEVSRGNHDCGAEAWQDAITRQIDPQYTILFGCSLRDMDSMKMFRASLNIPHKTEIIIEPLQTWKALIDGAKINMTGNTAGMWLAIGSHTRTCLLQHTDIKHKHNLMWDYKPDWDCKNIEVVDV